MNLYISRDKAERRAREICEARQLRDAKIECKKRSQRQPDRSVDVGWIAEIVTPERVRLFA